MQNTSIEWATHSFNPWHGCVKVSGGCKNCYAEVLDRRFGRAVWGPAKTTPRMLMSETYWKQPLRWNAQAGKTGVRARVFCASMADVFEDHPQVVDARARLMCLIDETPHLDWLLLTKRPENILNMIDPDFPANVWIGTSVENQEQADKRIPHLLRVPARVRFLSCEPLIGPVDLSKYLLHCEWCGGVLCDEHDCHDPSGLDWVICGGESGPGARPMHPDWARSLRDQCQAAEVNYFFKQWGEYRPATEAEQDAWVHQDDWHCKWVDANGRLYHGVYGGMSAIYKAGKHAAGRLLDGREWNEMPL